jgi:uncharacterized phage infection (PIP) family protein YhgE
MKKGLIAAVIAALALAPIAGATANSTQSVGVAPQKLVQTATPTQLLQLVQQLKSSTNVTTAQLQQLLTLLQGFQTSTTQLQGLLTQLGGIQNPPTALTSLLTLLQSKLTTQNVQTLQSLITQLQALISNPNRSQASIQSFLTNLTTLLTNLQLSPTELTQLLGFVRSLLTTLTNAQLLQLLHQFFLVFLTAEGTQNGKVTLCHKTGSKKHPYHKITVSMNAMPAHLRHGDLPGVGACPTHLAGTSATNAANAKNHGKGKGKHK